MSEPRALRNLGIAGSCATAAITLIASTYAPSENLAVFVGVLGAGLTAGLAFATALYVTAARDHEADRVVRAQEAIALGDSADLHGDGESLLALAIGLDRRLVVARTELDLLGAIVSSMEQGIVAVDRSEQITLANAQARSALNLGQQELIGQPLWEACRIEVLNRTIREALTTTAPVHGETTTGELGGRERHLEFRATPVVDDGGAIVGAVVVVTDISDLRRLERVRRDFVTNVSHELKTPLTAIRGMIETVLDDEAMGANTRTRFLKRVIVQGERLSELVADLLTLSRLESTSDVMDRRVLDLNTVIKTSAQQLLPAAQAKRITVRTDFERTPVPVSGDGEFLRQVADNLIDNAIKYTPPEGRVQVRLANEDGAAHLTVSDTGCGIAAADQERIFERFYRVDKARSRELGSTGLGLSIVKHVVHAHDGTIRVDSSPGKGTTFSVRLPLAAER